MTTCDGISSAELMRRFPITYRQLDHWCRVGYIQPHNHAGRENGNPGSGHQRCWAPDEVAKVQWFQNLVADLGLEHEAAWFLLRYAPDAIPAAINRLAKLHYQLTGENIIWDIVDA